MTGRRATTGARGLPSGPAHLVLGAAFALAVSSCAPAGEDVTVAIRGATVVNVATGDLAPDRTILVAGDRIAAVGPVGTTPVPEGATVVDGERRFVIPGLWDMHVHVFMGGDRPGGARTRADARSWDFWHDDQVAAGQREFSHAGMLGCVETREDWTDLEEVAGDDCDRAEAALTGADVWVTPTLTVFGADYAGPTSDLLERWKYVPWFYRAVWTPPSEKDPQQVEIEGKRLDRFLSMVDYFHDRGVPMMAGTDTAFLHVVPGYGLHQELSLLVDAGLTPVEALRAATLEPARYLEATDSLGTVEPGKVADLVVLDANPLDDIANTRRIHAVVADGVLLDRARLDEMLAAAAGRFEAPESDTNP